MKITMTRQRALVAALSALVLAGAVTIVALYARADPDARSTAATGVEGVRSGDPAGAVQPGASGPSASASASASAGRRAAGPARTTPAPAPPG